MDPIQQAIYIAILGISIVFVALTLISLFVLILQKTEPVAQETTAETVADGTSEGAIKPEILAVISAAVAVAIDQPHRIHQVRYRRVKPGAGWSSAGRMAVMTSHNPRGN